MLINVCNFTKLSNLKFEKSVEERYLNYNASQEKNILEALLCYWQGCMHYSA